MLSPYHGLKSPLDGFFLPLCPSLSFIPFQPSCFLGLFFYLPHVLAAGPLLLLFSLLRMCFP